jgi:P pilus assembly chaperone PapD
MSHSCLAGVSVVGTRFFIDDSINALNIKLINDNDSDYLIKTNINNDKFIISPPLFVLPKNKSNMVTIIPKEKNKNIKDEIYKLTITMIPKSAMSSDNNVLSLAIRSHFNLIYRHELPTDKNFNDIKLTRSEVGKWFLTNPTDFSFIVSMSKTFIDNAGRQRLLAPDQIIPVDEYCLGNTCSLWINILNEDNSILKKINLIVS